MPSFINGYKYLIYALPIVRQIGSGIYTELILSWGSKSDYGEECADFCRLKMPSYCLFV